MTDRNAKLEMEVAALGDLPREELVARWVKAYGSPPPKGFKRGLLERAAAWQLQAKALGGFSSDTRRMLTRATRQLEAGLKAKGQLAKSARDAAQATNAAGVSNGEMGEEANDPLAPASTQSSPQRELRAETFGARGSSPSQRDPLASGTSLLREWNGRQHFVEVVNGGYVFDGKPYRSLSAIARRITGAHWSGPRFFGL